MSLEDTVSTAEQTSSSNESSNPDQTDQNTGGGSASSTSETPGEGTKSTEIDTSKLTAEQVVGLLDREDIRKAILGDDSIKRAIQSEKDKEIARDKRRINDESRKREEAIIAQKDSEKRQQLISDGKGDELITFENEKLLESQNLTKSATKVAKIIEDVVRGTPEFRSLGEEKIDEIYSQIEKDGGNVVDFTLALSKERRDVDVKAATEAVTNTVKDTVTAEIEAALVAAGLKERSASASTTPSEAITSQTTPRQNVKPTTWEQASADYGAGKISSADFEPFRKKHEDERRY